MCSRLQHFASQLLITFVAHTSAELSDLRCNSALTAGPCAGLVKATRPTSTSVVVGLADVIAHPFALLRGVVIPLRRGACKGFTLSANCFSVDPSSSHTYVLDFLPAIQAWDHSVPARDPVCSHASVL